MRTYLAYPIDLVEPADRLHIAVATAHLRTCAKGRDILLYDPGSAFINTADAKIGPEIRQVNMTALDLSDSVLVLWPKGSRSWGVPIEIERAISQGKQVVLVTDQQPTWSMAWAEEGLLITIDPRDIRGSWQGAAAQGLAYLYETRERRSEALKMRGTYIEGEVRSFGPPEGQEDLPVKILSTRALGTKLPTRAYPDDAGLDLYVSDDHTIPPGQFVDVRSTVIGIELPEWSWGFLIGRSSTLRKKGLLVNPGVIDAGWRGGLFAGVWNLTDRPVVVKAGERLAQLILIENATRRVSPVEVSAVRESDRGTSGFGSTGA